MVVVVTMVVNEKRALCVSVDVVVGEPCGFPTNLKRESRLPCCSFFDFGILFSSFSGASVAGNGPAPLRKYLFPFIIYQKGGMRMKVIGSTTL